LSTTLILEDGTGVPKSNTYALVSGADSYHLIQGNKTWEGVTADKESALIRATQFIEATYRSRWPGVRLKFPQISSSTVVQGLSWPRYGALDYEGFPILPSVVPDQVVAATCEAALREISIPGQLQPDIVVGLKSEKAGDSQLVYRNDYGVAPHVSILDGILAPVLLTYGPFGTTYRYSDQSSSY
jgi:hypothetical protein